MQAHAWVASGEVCVTEGDSDEQFKLVSVFASRGKGQSLPA